MVKIKCTPMDTWTHLDRTTKTEWTRLKDDYSRIDIQSESLIKDEETHLTVAPNFSIN